LIYRDLLGCDLMKIKTVTNYLSVKEVSAIYRHLVEFIRSQHRGLKDVSDEEEVCLSGLYADITKLHFDNYKNL